MIIDTCVLEYIPLGVILDYDIDLKELSKKLTLAKGYPIEVHIKI